MPELAPDPTPNSRLELLQLAQSLGVSDADVMTRAELRAAIDKARHPEPLRGDQYPITWVSVARRLLASVVERGFNLPDAASLIRGDTKLTSPPKAPPPVATVTLARIYGAQGHVQRAVATLDEVLESDPDHELARDLRNQLEQRRLELLARAAAHEPEGVMGAPDDDDGFGDALPASDAGVAELLRAGDMAVAEGTRTAGGAADARDASGEAHGGAEVALAWAAPNGASAALAAASPAEVDGGADADLRGYPDVPFVDSPPLEQPATEVGIEPPWSAEVPAFEPPYGDSTRASAEPPDAWIPASRAADLPAADAGRVPDTARFAEPPATVEPPPFIDSAPVAEAEAVTPVTEPTVAVGEPAHSAGGAEPQPIEPRELTAELPTAVPPNEPLLMADGQLEAEALPSAGVDSAAASQVENPEIVAPTFDTVERSGWAEPVTEGPPAFSLEPPTMIGSFESLPVESLPADPGGALAPSVAVEADEELDTEPPATIASDVELPSESASIEPPPIVPTPIAPPPLAGMAAIERSLGEEPVHAPNGVARAVAPAVPNGTAAETAVTPETAASSPRVPGLVLIETGTPVRYVYWELADANLGAPHWIHVVSHTPTSRGGTERHERRFPVHRRLGVLRLEGVPARAILRARLTDTSDSRPLVVAGAVRPREAGPFEIRFSPHPNAKPDALATRAQPLLERASAVYWDG